MSADRKSGKQKRAQIKQQRLARAVKQQAQLRWPDVRWHDLEGAVPTDQARLAHCSPHGPQPPRSTSTALYLPRLRD